MRTKILARLYVDFHFFKIFFRKIPNKAIWKAAFYRYLVDTEYGYTAEYKTMVQSKKYLLKGFTSRRLCIVKKGHELLNADSKQPILISVVRNEKEKLPAFYLHYRKIGIKKFIVIDNDSTDGTTEYVKKQIDTDLYTVNEKFRGSLKEGWINQILAIYGYHRWYLVVDADELLIWPQFGEKTLKEVIEVFERYKQYRPLAIMLDMYSDGWLYQGTSNNDTLRAFCYCDKDTYKWIKNERVNILTGGPRGRVLGNEVWLSKTPLFYLKKGEVICNAHYMYPYRKYHVPKCFLTLLHYKFAYKSSYREMKAYVRHGIDSNRITESQKCLQKDITFFYEDSLHLDQAKKLCTISCVMDVFKILKRGH